MHACIAAISHGLPTVAVAYSNKFLGVMQRVGMGRLVADPRSTSAAQISVLFDSTFHNRSSIRHELQVVIPEVQATVLHLLEDADDLLNDQST